MIEHQDNTNQSPTMQKPTKVLLIGITVGALLIGAHLANNSIQSGNIESAIKGINYCIGRDIHDEHACDTADMTTDKVIKRLQDSIDSAQDSRHSTEPLFFAGALVIFLTSLPYIWYAFLRRLRELREAIMGK